MAIDVDPTSGKLVPANGAQWAEVLARLSTPLHHWGCQDASGALANSITPGDTLPYAGGAGGVAYQKATPGWTRKAVGYSSGVAPFGQWATSSLTGPSIDDDGVGAGSVLIFLLARQRVTSPPVGGFYGPFSPPDNYSYCLSYGNCELSAGTTTLVGTNSQTRFRARPGGAGSTPAGIVLESPDGAHADDNVHAFLMQVRETSAYSIEISLDTDLVSLETQAGSPGAGALSLSGGSTLVLPAYREGTTPAPVNFDHLDVWIWRGVAPLTPDERLHVLQTLKWRAAAAGPETAATFVLDLAVGGKVTYEWATDVHKSRSGKEKRVSLLGAPRQRFDFSAFLLDADDRTVRSALVVNAARGEPFSLTLPYEELEIYSGTSDKILDVGTTAACDWAQVGQRCVVRSPDRLTIVETFVTAFDATTITVNDAPGAVGARGATVSPLVPVYLDADLGFARHPRELTMFSIRATAATFGWGDSDEMGLGAVVTEHDGIPVLDRGHDIEGTSSDSIATGAELVDLGAIPLSVGNADAADFGRQVRLRGTRGGADDDFQWLKAFLFRVRGRQVSFLNPRWAEDFVYVSVPGAGQIRLSGAFPVWFDAGLGSFLQLLKTDNTRQYVGVSGYADAGGGTWDLTLSASVTGTVVRVSLLERCRFDSDTFEVPWQGGTFTMATSARVVRQ